MDTHDTDEEIRSLYRRLEPTVNAEELYSSLRSEAAKRKRRPIAGKPVRALAMACLALILLAGVGVGIFEVVKYLGKDTLVVVINDDTAGMSPGSTGGTGQTTQMPSTSDGTWQEMSLPQSGYPVCYQLVMDPADPNVLYAATGVGLFVSRDGAATWVQAEEFGAQVFELLVDPGPPSAVYVGFSDGNGGLRFDRTTDGGVTWEDAAALANRRLLAAFGLVLYARDFDAMGFDVIAKSSDGGISWESLALPAYARSKGYVFSVRADPRDPSRLYLYSPAVQSLGNLTAPGSVDVRVFVSQDGAQTWSDVEGEALDWAKAVAAAAPASTADAVTSASAFLSAAWQAQEYGTNTDTGAPFSISQASTLAAVDPTDPSILYVGTETGIYKSTDQGKTWNNTAAAMRTSPQAYMVVVNPLTPSTVYVTTQSTIFKSTDGGLSWASLFPAGAGWPSLAVAPSSPSTLYVWGSSGLSRSDDGGTTWAAPEGVGLPSLQPDEQVPGVMPGQGVVWDLLISSESPDTLLANTVDGIYRSTDGGDTWARPSGIPEKARGDEDVFGFGFPFDGRSPIFQARNDPSVCYAVLADRSQGFALALFTSGDGGQTWTRLRNLGSADQAYLPFAVDLTDPLTIYAQIASYTIMEDGLIGGVGTDAVFRRSTDAGNTWTEISTEGPGTFFDLYVDQWTGTTLYALAQSMGSGQSVYRSTDKGDSWEKLCAAPEVKSLVLGPSGVLYAVGGRTVYKWTPSAQ